MNNHVSDNVAGICTVLSFLLLLLGVYAHEATASIAAIIGLVGSLNGFTSR